MLSEALDEHSQCLAKQYEQDQQRQQQNNADANFSPLSPLSSPLSSSSSILSQRLLSSFAVSVAASPVPSAIRMPSPRLPSPPSNPDLNSSNSSSESDNSDDSQGGNNLQPLHYVPPGGRPYVC